MGKYIKKKKKRSGYTYTKNGKKIKVPAHKQRYRMRKRQPISRKKAREIMEKRSKRAQTMDKSKTSQKVLDHPTKEWAEFSNRMDVKGIDTHLEKVPKKDIEKTLKKVQFGEVHKSLNDVYDEFTIVNNLLYSAEHLNDSQIKKLNKRRDKLLEQRRQLKEEQDTSSFHCRGKGLEVNPIEGAKNYAYEVRFDGYTAYRDGLSSREKEKWRKCARWDGSSWNIYKNKKEEGLSILYDAGLIDEKPEPSNLRTQYLSEEERSDDKKDIVIEIDQENKLARIDGDEDVLKELDNLYSYYAKGHKYSKAYQDGRWDGKIHLINKNDTLPKNLAYNILSNKEELGEDVNIKVVDFRESAVRREPMELQDITLYDFQEEAVRKAIDKQQGLIISATGSGKTEMGAGIIAEYGEENDSVFLVHTTALQDQAEKRLEKRLGKDVGVGGGSRHAIIKTHSGDTNVMTVQSLNKALDKKREGKELSKKDKEIIDAYKDAEVIIQDEAHHVKAETFKENIDESNTKHIYGLTATPYRDENDELEVYSRLGSEVINISPDELIEKGKLVPPEINVIDVPAREEARVASEKYKGSRGSKRYNAIREAQVFNNPKRNKMIKELAEQQEQKGRTTLVFVDRIEHGENLSKELNAPFLNGQKSTKKQRRINEEILQDVREGDKKTIVATQQLFGEGFDMPAIDSLIIASAGKSRVQTMQKAGRALRPKKGKEKCEIYEFRDNVPYLDEHTRERIHTYEQHEHFDVKEKDMKNLQKRGDKK
jgi:superfamily II DNA or RNA helicase